MRITRSSLRKIIREELCVEAATAAGTAGTTPSASQTKAVVKPSKSEGKNMRVTRSDLRRIIMEELNEAYRDPTTRHQSELSFAQTNPPESKKALQQQYWGQHRGPSARREIESQLSSMSDEEQDEAIAFLIPDDPVTGQPGNEVWADLAMKKGDWDLHKGATGSRVPTRREAYLADLAWDVADGRVQMDEDKFEKLVSQSKTFRDTLSGAYGEIRTQEDIEDAFGHER